MLYRYSPEALVKAENSQRSRGIMYPRVLYRIANKQKKQNKRRGSATRDRATISMYRSPRAGFPFQMRMVHRYCSLINLTYTIGALPVYTFSANGLYDPDISSTGHQPMYFDQMAAIYNHYNVSSSRIVVKGSSPAATSGVTSVVGVTLDDDASIGYSFSANLIEDNTKKSAWAITGGVNAQTVALRCNWRHRQVFGGDLLADTENQGTSAANPADQSYYNVWLETTDRSTTTLFQAMVEIEYDTIWTEPKDIIPS